MHFLRSENPRINSNHLFISAHYHQSKNCPRTFKSCLFICSMLQCPKFRGFIIDKILDLEYKCWNKRKFQQFQVIECAGFRIGKCGIVKYKYLFAHKSDISSHTFSLIIRKKHHWYFRYLNGILPDRNIFKRFGSTKLFIWEKYM